jgi:hypothetical protein
MPPPAEECEVATILPAASAPLDSVTVTVIDHTSDHRTVIEYDFSPSSTINDMKNFISTDLKIDPFNFDIMSVKQRILPLYTTIESLSNEPKTFYIIKSTLAKVGTLPPSSSCISITF